MDAALKQVLNHQHLSRGLAKETMLTIGEGEQPAEKIAGLLAALAMRPVTANELAGFRDALLALCYPVKLTQTNLTDVCGTGGDGKNTFNISTLSAIVAAAAGCTIAKHGNNGVSSKCGSSNVLVELDYNFTNQPAHLQTRIIQHGIAFLHAPLFHPAMRHVAPARKALGIKTIFNLLGPLVNPAPLAYQSAGVYSLAVGELYQQVLSQTQINFVVVHSLDGYDEISLTGPAKIWLKDRTEIISPTDFDLPTLQPNQIEGGHSVAQSAQIFKNVLDCTAPMAHLQVVAANAALPIWLNNPGTTLKQATHTAMQALETKQAQALFNAITQTTVE